MPHREVGRSDEAFPSGSKRQPLDGASRRVRPIEHPDALAVLRRSLEHVEERRHVSVDAAAEVLEIDQDRIERSHRLTRRTAYFSIKAEDGDSVFRVREVRGLHHIVLEVASDTVLRSENSRHVQSRREQGVEAVRQVLRDRRRMSEKRDALAFERAAKLGVSEQPVDSEQGHSSCLGKPRGEATGVVEIRLLPGM